MPASSTPTPEPAARGDRAFARAAAALALLAFALRAAHVVGLSGGPWFEAPPMDMGYHLEWARTVAAGDTFQPGEPFFRAPLYPWFLAAALKVGGGSIFFALLVQCALGAATTWLTFLLGRRLFGPAEGLGAAAVTAGSWVLIHFDGQLLIPALLVPLTLLALLATQRLVERADAPTAAVAGLAWGLAAICRPNVLLGLPLLALWLLLARRGGGPPRWLATVALTAGTLTPILPLTAYNAFVAHDPALISTQAGVNLWIGNNPASDGVTAVVPGTRAGWWEGYHDAIAQAEAYEGRPLSATGVSRSYARRAFEWVRESPGDAARHFRHKLDLLASGDELGNNVDPRFTALEAAPWLALSPVHLLWVLPLALVGLVRLWRAPGLRAPVLIHLGAYSASIALFFVNARFRAPLLPVLYVLAVAGALRLVRRWRVGERARVALTLLVLVVVGVSVARPARTPGTGVANGATDLARGYGLRAEEARAQGDQVAAAQAHDRALELAERALAARADWGPAWQTLGALRRGAGDVAGALEAYERAVELGAGEVAIDGLLGTLRRAGRSEDAVRRARELRALGSAGASYVLAVHAFETGRDARALELVRESESRAPGRFRAAWLEFLLARRAQDLERAEALVPRLWARVSDATPEQRDQLRALLE